MKEELIDKILEEQSEIVTVIDLIIQRYEELEARVKVLEGEK